MKRQQVIRLVTSVCTYLRLSQAKTLSELVTAAMATTRTSIAQLGRTLSCQNGIAAKHCIKRVDRFIGNERVEVSEAMRGVVQWLMRPRSQLLVGLDWVDIRDFHCIVLAARLRGRAIPLLWAVYRYEDVYRSQNNLEYGLLRLFRTMVPKSTEVVILGDRGFGRTEMARVCQELEFGYIIRIEPTVHIQARGFRGRLTDLPIRKASSLILHNVLYRKDKPVIQHVAVVWLADQDEPWYLMTNIDKIRARKLASVFARRMSIEEYFRDTKSKRNGFAMRLTMIRDSQRLSRFLLILALAYILLVTIGLYASSVFAPAMWCSNNRTDECSLFTIGKFMLSSKLPPLRPTLKALRNEILLKNWG